MGGALVRVLPYLAPQTSAHRFGAVVRTQSPLDAMTAPLFRTFSRPRWAGMAVVFWASFQVAACETPTDHQWTDDDEGGGDDDEVTRQVALHQVSELVPGAQAEVSGANLDRVSRITVDGQSVSFEASSSEAGSFKVPELRDCETDGRPVTLTIEGRDVAREALSLRETLQLEVSESRVLSREDLECLQLPGGDEAYALSVASFTSDLVVEEPLTLTGRPAGGGDSLSPGETSASSPSSSPEASPSGHVGLSGASGLDSHHTHEGGILKSCGRGV